MLRPGVPVVPVIDVMGGSVVRAVGGRRCEYRPVVSRLTTSVEPVDVARALLATTRSPVLYVADLDAIVGGDPPSPAIVPLGGLGVRLWVDAGIRTADARIAPADEVDWLFGSETVTRPAVIPAVMRRLGRTAATLSLDLYDGHIMGDWKAWNVSSPSAVTELVDQAVGEYGVTALIVLDVSRVGRGDGAGTEHLVEAVARRHPKISLAAGGGIRGWDDYRRLADAGASAVLASTAIHDGTLFG